MRIELEGCEIMIWYLTDSGGIISEKAKIVFQPGPHPTIHLMTEGAAQREAELRDHEKWERENRARKIEAHDRRQREKQLRDRMNGIKR